MIPLSESSYLEPQTLVNSFDVWSKLSTFLFNKFCKWPRKICYEPLILQFYVFNKPCFKVAGGTRLNPCEKRLVNLRDRANMITDEHTTHANVPTGVIRLSALRINSIPIVFYWWNIPIITSVYHLFPICWFFAAVCFIFPVKYNTSIIEWIILSPADIFLSHSKGIEPPINLLEWYSSNACSAAMNSLFDNCALVINKWKGSCCNLYDYLHASS